MPNASEAPAAMKPAIAGFTVLMLTQPRPDPQMPIVGRDCWGAEDRSRSFSGTMSTTGGTIQEQIGRRGRDRVIQSSLGDLRFCAVTNGFDGDLDDRPSQWSQHSDRVILETRMPNDVR